MKSPLIPDSESQKWVIAQFILKAIGSGRAKKTASRLKIPDVERFLDIMKVIVIADLFERAYSDFISELEENEKLKRFVDVKEIPDLDTLYKLHSKLDIKAISTFFRGTFKVSKRRRQKGRRYILIDATPIKIDLNTWRNRRRIGKDGKPYRWSYYPSEGYYVGFKLIVAIDAENYELLDYELYDGCPNDAKTLIPFLKKLYSSRKMRMGDLIICDKGYSSMKNYIATINRFFVVPIIYPRKNTNMKKIEANLVPPLDVWAGKAYLLDIWKKIRREFLRLIEEWEAFREKRSRIEVLFDIVKNTLGLKSLHQYTGRSVEKRVCRTFHLAFYLIHLAGGMGIGVRELVYW
jgi:Transposase DDE domain.